MIKYELFSSLERAKIWMNQNVGKIEIISISGTSDVVVWYSPITTKLLSHAHAEYARN